ncbi:hypothetical protein [Oceaniglobus ichthyenteri]|nr:hypothetical protein [Oceaniglobus ichthyenteri]
MSKSIKTVFAIGLIGLVAACAQKNEEVVFADPAPITVEPTYTGKYK